MMDQEHDLDTHQKYFWDAAARGELLIKRCRSCGEAFFYPRPACPFCASRETEWLAASGEGKIYSFSLMRRKGQVVAIPAYVALSEGPVILTALLGASPERFAIGQRVRLTFVPTAAHASTPVFALADPGGSSAGHLDQAPGALL